MHTFNETAAGVPAFLAKLWRLVDDPETNNLICWNKDGRSFIIQNQAQFARELLPLNYKHNNMASFIRQLNMYGFHKITSIDNGGLKFDRDEMEFSHPCFKRNCPYLLEHIKRKIANTKSIDEKSAMKPEAVSKVLQDVKAMRGRQDSLDSRFSVMKQENEALWREIASLRQKHAKQQQIVNKLIQFLITIVQPSRNMTSVKRHMQLMIHDTPENAKLRKASESESDCGPVIHELGEELLDEVNEVDPELIYENLNSPYAKPGLNLGEGESPLSLNMERPHSSISMASQNYDYSNQSADDVLSGAGSSASGTGNGNATNVTSAVPNNAGGSSVIHSVDRDGTEIIYHVTEVPDAQPHDTITTAVSAASPSKYNDENVLHTPLVRQEIARSQMLKQRNKLRRKQDDIVGQDASSNNNTTTTANKILRSGKQLPTATATSSLNTTNPGTETVQVKSENPEIDPMLFLNTYTEAAGGLDQQSAMISPNLSEDSLQAGGNNANLLTQMSASNVAPNEVTMLEDNNTNMYNPNDFITGDIPSDIFDNSLLIADDNTLQDESKSKPKPQPQQFDQTAVSNGKFSTFVIGNNNNVGNNNNGNTVCNAAISPNGPSTSAAAAINSTSVPTSTVTTASTSQGKESNATTNTNNRNGNGNMAVTKYKLAQKNHDAMRLNTADEVNGHLENVQDELETLKDLLRGDGYSLDANTLMGNGPMETSNKNQMFLAQGLDGDFLNKLFNDSEILGPYGLQFPSDGFNENKKGSELAAYQPFYDLSDIIDINNEKPALMGSGQLSPAGRTQGQSSSDATVKTSTSTLNTPYHE